MPLTDATCKNARCPEGKARERYADSGGLYREACKPIADITAPQLLAMAKAIESLRAPGLRTKQVEHLVSRWQAEGACTGTMKNRMSALRWVAEKISKENMVARDNAACGIAHRR